MSNRATILAGVPAISKAVYHRIGFVAHDPAVCIEIEGDQPRSIVIVRDVELIRARQHITAARVYCPKDFTPPGGLSGDREIATAQAAIECLRRHAVQRATGDRSLPLVYVAAAREAGIEIDFDPDLGVLQRRRKSEQEIAHLRECQRVTEEAIRMVCELIARAPADSDGMLRDEGEILTSEHVRRLLDLFLMKAGYTNDESIIAAGPIGADCHHPGAGAIRTGVPVIIDVFPQNKKTLYHGDCTRMVVHGEISPEISRAHGIVVEAKKAAETATRAGTTGDAVHQATVEVMRQNGVHIGFPEADSDVNLMFLPHGTGHGIGLDLKEPPLLDFNGVELLEGDCVTIEPGIYCRAWGGIRIEDMYIITATGVDNLNRLPETLVWK